MPYTVSNLWHRPKDDLIHAIDACLENALAGLEPVDGTPVFFRADDVAVPGRQFQELIRIFRHHQVPLSMAVVPAWLTAARWDHVEQICRADRHLWCFYQHGWRHKNHETKGKKQEFGPARSTLAIEHDLRRGRDRLAALMGKAFYPGFTPPWNRCSEATLASLKAAGYRALSRSRGAFPPAPEGLVDVQVNVDLHTRKERTSRQSWEGLFGELTLSIQSGFCGIMIHHQRMNENAFVFLDLLLERMRAAGLFRIFHLKHIKQFHARKKIIP